MSNESWSRERARQVSVMSYRQDIQRRDQGVEVTEISKEISRAAIWEEQLKMTVTFHVPVASCLSNLSFELSWPRLAYAFASFEYFMIAANETVAAQLYDKRRHYAELSLGWNKLIVGYFACGQEVERWSVFPLGLRHKIPLQLYDAMTLDSMTLWKKWKPSIGDIAHSMVALRYNIYYLLVFAFTRYNLHNIVLLCPRYI